MTGIINYMRGYVEVEVIGPYPQEMINLLAENRIDFWGLQQENELCYQMKMHIFSYRKVRALAKKSMCHLHIKEKRGVPFFFNRMKKRRVLLAGLIILLIIACAFPQFVWSFEVVGNETVPEQKIIRALEELGVTIGTFGPSIRASEIKNDMLLKIKELSWITINVNGGRAIVSVRERVEKPEIVDINQVTNIVANKTGIITRMEIRNGSPVVKTGQTILKGEMLVTGVIDRTISVQQTHAMGEIYARTWYKVSAEIPLSYVAKSYTGSEKTNYALIFGGKRINLYFNGGISYSSYVKIIERNDLTLPQDITLPLGLIKETYVEYEPCESFMDEEQAVEILKKYLLESVRQQLNAGQISESRYEISRDEELVRVTLICECEEQIGVEIPVSGT